MKSPFREVDFHVLCNGKVDVVQYLPWWGAKLWTLFFALGNLISEDDLSTRIIELNPNENQAPKTIRD